MAQTTNPAYAVIINGGDNPGRKQPATGEINYNNIFKYLHQKGYNEILGREHGIVGRGEEGELVLIKAYRKIDSFLSLLSRKL